MRAFSCFLVVCSGVLVAAPEGMRVLHGEATHEGVAVHTKEEKTVLEWDRFSLEKGESLHFQQPSVSASVLNRVTGEELSAIHGLLSSNGSLYLINPNGVLIGPEGRIETAGFVASSLDILNDDFLSDKHAFHGPGPGAIVNLGTIYCASGSIALIGRKVQNEGLLEAPQGSVGLGVGQEIFLQPKNHPYLLIRAPLFGKEEGGAAITHSGRIQALKAELRSGSSVYQTAIQSSGIIDALKLEEKNGEIYLVADKGICSVTGSFTAPGGTVHVLSEKVGLFDPASIDVSGKFGGGTILVGGDFQGKNLEIPSAMAVFAGKETVLKADALESGNGGKVILWSEKVTRHYGAISAQGGSLRGDGGLVEVSGKELDFDGRIILAAPKGKIGALFLDPTNITISTGADSGGSFSACSGGASSFTASGASNTINTTTLVNNLQAPCDITISTASGDASAGTLTVSNAVSWNTASKLTLISESTMTISANVTSTSTDTTNQDAIVMYATSASGNAINVASGVTISAAGARGIRMAGTTSSTGSGINTNSSVVISTVDGDINLFGTQTGTGGAYGIFGQGANVQATGLGNITGTGTRTASPGSFGNGILIFGGAWSVKDGAMILYGRTSAGTNTNSGINISPTGSTASTITITGVGTITMYGTGFGGATAPGIWIGHDSLSGTCRISGASTAGAISLYGYSSAGTGDGNVGVLIRGGNVGDSSTPNIVIRGTGLSTGTNSMGVAVTAGGQAGVIQIAANGTLTITGTGGPGTTSKTTNHGISMTNTSHGSAGTITLGAGATVTLTGTGGGGSSGSHYGVNLASGTFTMTGGTQVLSFKDCSGGSGGNNNRGVNIALSLAGTGTGSSITFDNVVGGSSGSNSYGVYIPTGVTVQADVVKTFDSSTRIIKGGSAASDSNFGLYVNAGTLQVNSTSTLSSITAYAIAGSTNAVGVKVDSAGTIKTAGAGGLTITGSGSLTGSGAANYGFYATGASTTLSTTSTGTLTLNGIAGAGTTEGLFLSVTPILTTTGAGTVALNTGFTTQNIGLSTSTFTLASGGNVTFGSPVILTTSTQTITASGTGNISFNSTVDGAQTVNLTVGTGAITFSGAVGGTTRLTSLGLSGASGTLNLGANISLNNSSFAPAMPTALTGSSTINTGTTGAAITFAAAITGAQALTLAAGTGAITLGANVGVTGTRLTSLTFTSGSGLTIGPSAVFVTGGFAPGMAVALAGTTSITTTNTAINFNSSSTINGSGTLTLDPGSGGSNTVTFTAAVGATTPLTSLTVSQGSTLTQSSTVQTTGAVSYTSSSISIGGNITSAGGAITLGGATSITGNVAMDTTNSGASAAGAAIQFSSTLNSSTGSQSLTLSGGTGGTVTFAGLVGATTQIGVLNIPSAANIAIQANITCTSGTWAGSLTFTDNPTVTTQ